MKIMQNKQHVSDEFGSRSPVIHTPCQTKSAISIVARVLSIAKQMRDAYWITGTDHQVATYDGVPHYGILGCTLRSFILHSPLHAFFFLMSSRHAKIKSVFYESIIPW